MAATGPIARRAASVLASGGRRLQSVLPGPKIPSPDQRQGTFKTNTRTYVTKPTGEGEVLFSADIAWTRVKLLLETGGPVAVSTAQQFTPVLSGKGILLQTGQELELDIAMGNRLYIAATAVNRVRVVTQPFSWAEQILGAILHGFDGLGAVIGSVLGGAR